MDLTLDVVFDKTGRGIQFAFKVSCLLQKPVGDESRKFKGGNVCEE